MATHIAVVSLMHDLEQFLNSTELRFAPERFSGYLLDEYTVGSHQIFCPFTKKEIDNLYQTVSSIDSFLRDSSGESYNHEFMNQVLEKRIGDVTQKAGNFVDFWAVLSLGNPQLDVITSIVRRRQLAARRFTGEGDSSGPSRGTPNTKRKLVGLEEDLKTMVYSLIGRPPHLKVCPIIGAAGIGKTAFVRKLYANRLIIHHFHVRVWVTVSRKYHLEHILKDILCCVTNSDVNYGKSKEELSEQVYRSLKGKRYLIVLDDLCDTNAWDDLKRAFPDNTTGCRIMLTSQFRDVAVHAGQDTPPHCVRCLNTHASWELLSSKIFGDEPCPLELMAIGKKIAYECQGLPLAIIVVGGLLSKMNKRLLIWEEVAQSVGSPVMEEAEHFRNILALSYSNLPVHLKACLLYTGVLPAHYKIPVGSLTFLWVAEGFIRPTALKTLEEVAEGYLEDLIARSLIMVSTRSSDGRINTCYILDLMRELCLRESQKQNFLHVINGDGQPGRNLHDKRKVILTEIAHEIVSINEELKKIHDGRKVQDLEVTSSKGMIH